MPRRPLRAILSAALVGAVLLAAGCTSTPKEASPTAAGPVVPGTTLPASPTALPTYSLEQFRTLLAQLHGRPVVVNFWATWCGPCVDEAPALASLAKAYAGKVQFLGVDIGDSATAARAWVRRYGWTYPSVSDPTRAIENGMGYIGQPVTVVFDAKGTQVLVLPGSIVALHDEPKLRTTLDALP